jgi:uncharacterized protein (DUF433 family)
VTAPQIRIDDEGVAWIEGTTAKVVEIVLTKIASGLTPEELQSELPHLTVTQVQAALAYYQAHQEALDAEIERRRHWVEEMAAQSGESPFGKRLQASRQLPR